ncbi:MAG: SCO family protein, partial [Anaerolineaceae bacterium]|nr:SCO family protein [Anaerolineaceae bacterium]
TVDPQRDTAERLNTYVSAFSPGIIGLTGTEEELQTVWSGYGVYREIDDSHSADNYLVTHTSRLYLVDKQGRLRLTYPFGTPVGDIVEDVRYLLKEG